MINYENSAIEDDNLIIETKTKKIKDIDIND